MVWLWASASVVVALLLLRAIAVIVRQDTVVIVEDVLTGRRRVLQPGFNFCSPFWVVHRRKWRYEKGFRMDSSLSEDVPLSATSKSFIKTNVRTYDPDVLQVRTRDQVDVEIDLLCHYQITDPLKAITHVDNLKAAIAGGINTEVYRRVASVDHQDLNHADIIGTKELKAINAVLGGYGVTVHAVRVEGIRMPENIAEAIQRAVAQRQVGVTDLKAVETQNNAKIQMAKAEMQLMDLQHERELRGEEHRAKVKRLWHEVEVARERALKDLFTDEAAFVAHKQTEAWGNLAGGRGQKTVFAPLDALQMAAFVASK